MSTLAKILSEIFQIEESKITPELAIHTTQTWNSLTHIELVLKIEEVFRLQLTDDEIVAMTSLNDIQRVLTDHGVRDR